jgi:hypothetical protein
VPIEILVLPSTGRAPATHTQAADQLDQQRRDRCPRPTAPVHRRFGFLITPATILRSHRQLVRRRWTTRPARAGPAVPTGVRALIVRLATENPT